MSLRSRFANLYATAATQGSATAELEGGAVLTVKADGRRRQVVIARPGVPVGLTETDTFVVHGDIPPWATGVCYFPTKAELFRVVFTWETIPTLFDMLAEDYP